MPNGYINDNDINITDIHQTVNDNHNKCITDNQDLNENVNVDDDIKHNFDINTVNSSSLNCDGSTLLEKWQHSIKASSSVLKITKQKQKKNTKNNQKKKKKQSKKKKQKQSKKKKKKKKDIENRI